jgi:hypothetical protein
MQGDRDAAIVPSHAEILPRSCRGRGGGCSRRGCHVWQVEERLHRQTERLKVSGAAFFGIDRLTRLCIEELQALLVHVRVPGLMQKATANERAVITKAETIQMGIKQQLQQQLTNAAKSLNGAVKR